MDTIEINLRSLTEEQREIIRQVLIDQIRYTDDETLIQAVNILDMFRE